MHLRGKEETGAEATNWPLLLGVWALISAVFIARTLFNAADTPLFADTDDAMRLVVVRDLLGGQGWYDHVQHRLNTPFGAELHWSRLVDLPLAGLLLLLSPFGAGPAATILAYAWPLLLLLGLLWLSVRIALRLVGPDGLLPALALPALSPPLMAEFAPGRLDHHNVQILLTLLLAWCAVEAIRRPRYAIGAGYAAATAMAIGTEAIAAVAAAILAFGLLWVFRPERADALRGFGLSFAACSLVHLAVALPPQDWLVPACDRMSSVYALAALAVGMAFLVLSLLPLARAPARFRLLAGVAAGATVMAAVIAAFPQCLGGPFAEVDPWLVRNWIARISEAKPLWESISALPAYTLAIAIPPIAALGGVALRLWRGGAAGRAAWWVFALFLAVEVTVMLVQVRGARLAAPLAIAPAAWMIGRVRERYLLTRTIRDAGLLLGSWVLFAGIGLLVLVNAATMATAALRGEDQPVAAARADKNLCLLPAAFAELAALPPERIMTPIDLGSHMLLETPHAVVAAPYHRNEQGVLDAFAFFNGPIDAVREILAARGVTLVVVCPAMSEIRDGYNPAADSFVTLLQQDRLPDWLVEQTLPGAPLRVFAVLPR